MGSFRRHLMGGIAFLLVVLTTSGVAVIPRANAAIALEDQWTGTFINPATTGQVPVTVPGPLNHNVLFVTVAIRNTLFQTVQSVDLGLSSLTRVAFWSALDKVRNEIWMLVDPTVGSNNVVVTTTGITDTDPTVNTHVGVFLFSGVENVGPSITSITATDGEVTSATVPVSSSIGDIIFGQFANDDSDSGVAITSGFSMQQLLNVVTAPDSKFFSVVVATRPAAQVTSTMSITTPTFGDKWTWTAFAIKPYIDECSPSPCLNGATCTDGVYTYVCTCAPGYNGINCETEINECSVTPCQNGATCTDLIAAYQCTCVAGYTGANCQTNINECAINPCLNNGVCADGINDRTCFCPTGFTGPDCEIDLDECASGNPCANGGTCNNHPGFFNCSCPLGYTGTFCEININECATTPCDNGGTCTDGIGTYTCACDATKMGTNCEIALGTCGTSPCVNGGNCTEISMGIYNCSCVAGYGGSDCQFDIDDCSTNPCLNGATCIDLLNDYTCTCASGFTGLNCETNINDCIVPCQNGGTCLDGVNSFVCACVPGFTDLLCGTNINDCTAALCLNGGTCVDGLQSHSCSCASGFTGTNCSTGVDFCSTSPCFNGGTCANGIGSYSCVCANGFSGSQCQTGSSGASTSDESGFSILIVVGVGAGVLLLVLAEVYRQRRKAKRNFDKYGDIMLGAAGLYGKGTSAYRGDDADLEMIVIRNDAEGREASTSKSKSLSRSGSRTDMTMSMTSSSTDNLGAVTPEFLASFKDRSTEQEMDEYFGTLINNNSRKYWKDALGQYMTPMSLFDADAFALFCSGFNVHKWIFPLLVPSDVGASAEDAPDVVIENFNSVSMSGEQSLVQLALLLVNEVHFRQVTLTRAAGVTVSQEDLSREVGVRGVSMTLAYFREAKEWARSDISVTVCRLVLYSLTTKLSTFQVRMMPTRSDLNHGLYVWTNLYAFLCICEEFIMHQSSRLQKSASFLSLSVSVHGFEDFGLVKQILIALNNWIKCVEGASVDPRPVAVTNLISHLQKEKEFYEALSNYMVSACKKTFGGTSSRSMSMTVDAAKSFTVAPSKEDAEALEAARDKLAALMGLRQMVPATFVSLKEGVLVISASARAKKAWRNPYAEEKAPYAMLMRSETSLITLKDHARLIHVAKFARRVLSTPQASMSASMGGQRSTGATAVSGVRSAYSLDEEDAEDLRKHITKANQIGEGAFGKVYKVRFRGDDAALKVVHMKDKGSLSRFVQEVEAQANIRSSRLLSVVAYYCKPPDLFLITDLMARGSLADVLDDAAAGKFKTPSGENGVLSSVLRLRFAVDTCKALVFLHGSKPPLLHGDVKVHNVLVDNNLSSRVGDFGLSRDVRETAGGNRLRGSMVYMAPEMFSPSSVPQTVETMLKTDVYAFGMLLWECFTGVGGAPWCEMDRAELLTAHAQKRERVLSRKKEKHIPAQVNRIAKLCLKRDPQERPTMSEVLDMLEQVKLA